MPGGGGGAHAEGVPMPGGGGGAHAEGVPMPGGGGGAHAEGVPMPGGGGDAHAEGAMPRVEARRGAASPCFKWRRARRGRARYLGLAGVPLTVGPPHCMVCVAP